MIKIPARLQNASIQTRLIIYYIVFAIVTVALVASFAYYQAEQSLRSSVQDKLDTVARLKINFLNQWVDEQQGNVVLLSNLPELRRLSGLVLDPDASPADRLGARRELTRLVIVITQRSRDFQDVQILDHNGEIVISAAAQYVGKSQFEQPYFTEGQTRIVTQRFYDSDLFGKPTLTVAAPLFDDSEKRVGVLALHFNTREVDSIIQEDQKLNESIQSYLISSHRQIITEDPIQLSRSSNLESPAIDSALEGGQGFASYINHDGVQVIGRYFWIENQNAALIVEIDEETALWPARRLAISIVAVGSVFSLLLVIVIIILARRITTPLRMLTAAAARISAGDLDAITPVLSDDEVGSLARAFNSMTGKLRETLAGLQEELRERKQAEDVLLQFRNVMDETNDAIFMIDPETSKYIDFNKVACEQLGYSREELGQLGVIDIAQHIPNLVVWQERVELVNEKGNLLFETAYRRRDGTTFPVEVSVRMLAYNGKMIMVAIARDITGRKLTESALRESEERFRKVFHSSPVAICITTLEEGRLLEANYAYWDLTGYNPETPIGRNAEVLRRWDSPEGRTEFVKNLKLRHSLFNPDDYFHHVDGSMRFVISFYELMHIGQEDCILSMFYDMSAQKRALQALQQSEARARALLDAIPDLIFEITTDGIILKSFYSSVEELFIWPDQFIGKRIDEVMPEPVGEGTIAAIQRAVESGRVETFEYQLPMQDGSREYEARLVASGTTSVLAIVRDITQRKWMETEREKFIYELEIQNRESETLRESLASIVGTFQFEEIVRRILEQIRRVVPYDTASVWRYEGQQQIIITGVDLPPEIKIPGTILAVDPSNSTYPILHGEASYILSNNVQEELSDFPPPHDYINSWLAIPLKTRGRVIGVIALDGRRKNQFNQHHAELAVTFANQVAIALDNASLFNELQIELTVRENLIKELEDKNAEAETMRESIASVVGTFEFSVIVQRILDQISRVVPYDSASVWRLEENRQILIGGRNLPAELTSAGLEFELGDNNHAMPLFKGECAYLISHDVQADFPRFQHFPHNYINSWLGVPLKARGKVTGLIALDGFQRGQFNVHHAELAVTFADQVAIALENARLFADLQGELEKQIALRNASMAISSSLHLDQVLNEICKQMCVILDGTSAYIAQYDEPHVVYTVVAEYMSSNANPREMVSDRGMSYYKRDGAWLFEDATTADFEVVHAEQGDLSPWAREVVSTYGGKSILYVPLHVQGRLLGHAELWDSRVVREFNRDEIAFCRAISQQAAIAIANASLFEQLQRELKERKDLIAELESKNAELERFTYTVSHDLKSPLFTIRGFLGYLEQDALAGDHVRMKADMQRITTATEKMQNLLNDLLELSRIGRLKNASVSIPFGDLAREAVELVHGRIMEHGVAIQIDADLPTVFGDRPRLLEVLQNLLDNAAKFMGPQREPRIEIGQSGEEPVRGMPIFHVRDNGIGIAPEHFERIFGLFNKLDVKSDGTGIGLALVKRIVEVHGGRIWVESEVGNGTVFRFTLPRAPDEVAG